MAAALECWSGRPSTDEDAAEQVLMRTHGRSEAFSLSPSSAASSPSPDAPSAQGSLPPPKKWQRLGRNFAGAIAAIKSSLNLDSTRDASPLSERLPWAGIVRNHTELYPRSQLSQKLVNNLRHHFDSLPNSYSQAGFDVEEVLLHAKLVEQAATEDQPAVSIEQVEESYGGAAGVVFKLTFACNSPLSWQVMSGSLDSSLICCKKIQIFEKKGLTLGVATIQLQAGNEAQFKSWVEAALRSAAKKRKNNGMKLPFGFCGCQEEGLRNSEEDSHINADAGQVLDSEPQRRIQLPNPLPESSLVVAIDVWQTFRSGGEVIGRWMLNPDEVEFVDRVGSNSFKAVYRGKKVWVKKLRGCDTGSAYEIEIRQDLLLLMSCGQRNILQFHGICFKESHGLCVVTRMMEGGSVHDLVQKKKRLPAREAIRIALDVAEGLMFMNNHGVAYRDLNTQRILLDKQGNACLGDMGIVTPCNNAGEVTEYETAGYRWLAPEIIAGDPEGVSETWMSNVYSFGMVLWEMVTGEEAFSSYSPVQAAVGIAACGLRPEIPKDCPQFLRSLMNRCWNNCPSKRPTFAEIATILQRQNSR